MGIDFGKPWFVDFWSGGERREKFDLVAFRADDVEAVDLIPGFRREFLE